MKYLTIFFITAILLIFEKSYGQVCGEDGIPCVDGMPGCTICNFRPPGIPGAPNNPIWIEPVPVNPPAPPPSLPFIPTIPLPPFGAGGVTTDDVRKQKADILARLKISDCDGVKRANEVSKNVDVQKAIQAIKDKPKEWGVEIELPDPSDPSKFILGEPFTQENKNLITFNPTWDNNNGHTIGFIHNHPSGSAPSPSDIFNASFDLMDVAQNLSIPPEQFLIYLNNFPSLIVSDNYIYTITIKDAQLFAYMTKELYGERQIAENIRYTDYSLEAFDNLHGDPNSNLDIQRSQESALLQLFGKMFNLNKQKLGDTDQNEAVKRDSEGNILVEDPCKP